MNVMNGEQMFFPSDRQNTKKLKTKMLSFYKQQMYFSQIVSKKAKISILFFMNSAESLLKVYKK